MGAYNIIPAIIRIVTRRGGGGGGVGSRLITIMNRARWARTQSELDDYTPVCFTRRTHEVNVTVSTLCVMTIRRKKRAKRSPSTRVCVNRELAWNISGWRVYELGARLRFGRRGENGGFFGTVVAAPERNGLFTSTTETKNKQTGTYISVRFRSIRVISICIPTDP